MKKLLFIALTSLLLIGCATKPITTTTVQAPIVIHPTKPEPLDLKDITWQVWNYDRLQQAALEADPNQEDFAIVVLTFDNYENFALNIEQIESYIEQQIIRLQYYRELFPETSTAPEK